MLKTLLNGLFPFVPYYNFLDQGRKELKIYLFLQLDEISKKISSPFSCLEQLFIDVSFLMCFSNIFVKTSRDGDRNISPGNLYYWFFKTVMTTEVQHLMIFLLWHILDFISVLPMLFLEIKYIHVFVYVKSICSRFMFSSLILYLS